MKNQWMIWTLIAAVIVIAVFALNFEGGQKSSLSLMDIFPEQQLDSIPDVEYEFIEETSPEPAPLPAKASKPVQPAKPQAAPPVKMSAPAASAKPESREPASAAKAAPAAPPAVNVASMPFTIQVASYKEKSHAELSLKGLLAAGYPASLVAKDLGDKGTWYRIYVGSFQTKDQANEFLSKMKPEYKNSFVISNKK
ncbi:MAG: SPOR domain-containing protein [Candidatus Omnitrophota bacterium]|nr:SPOR domain-containing protein [Candidatus Omnitrophota bacterium]MDZ4242759.1 SPOR domain-containing protein [Candidatus Omnitrophota bacterium]